MDNVLQTTPPRPRITTSPNTSSKSVTPSRKQRRTKGGIRKPLRRHSSRTSPRCIRRPSPPVEESEDDEEISDYERDIEGARELVNKLRDSQRNHEAAMLQMVVDEEEDHYVSMLILRMNGCLKRRVRPAASL